MDTPKVGTQVLCGQCGEAIEWRGEYWDHIGENKPRHPAIPATYKVVPSQSNDDLEERLRGIARDEATHVLAAATIPPYPAYFMQRHWLITYDWHRAEVDRLETLIERLRQHYIQLRHERLPWWKRWLNR